MKKFCSKSLKKILTVIAVSLGMICLSACGGSPSADVPENVSVLDEDFNESYPKNVRVVMQKYGECMTALYNEDLSDDTFEAIADQMSLLFDDELLENQSNYLTQLKNEIETNTGDGYTISKVVVPESDKEVDYFTKDERECAGIEILFSVRNGNITSTVLYTYVLRRELDTSRWKIYGWEVNGDQTINLVD